MALVELKVIISHFAMIYLRSFAEPYVTDGLISPQSSNRSPTACERSHFRKKWTTKRLYAILRHLIAKNELEVVERKYFSPSLNFKYVLMYLELFELIWLPGYSRIVWNNEDLSESGDRKSDPKANNSRPYWAGPRDRRHDGVSPAGRLSCADKLQVFLGLFASLVLFFWLGKSFVNSSGRIMQVVLIFSWIRFQSTQE